MSVMERSCAQCARYNAEYKCCNKRGVSIPDAEQTTCAAFVPKTKQKFTGAIRTLEINQRELSEK